MARALWWKCLGLPPTRSSAPTPGPSAGTTRQAVVVREPKQKAAGLREGRVCCCAGLPGEGSQRTGTKGAAGARLRPGSRPRAGGGTAPLSRPRALWPAAGPGEPKPSPARCAGSGTHVPAARGPLRTSASLGCFGGRKQPGEVGGDVVFSVLPATLQCRLPVLCHLGQRAGERAYSSCTNNH